MREGLKDYLHTRPEYQKLSRWTLLSQLTGPKVPPEPASRAVQSQAERWAALSACTASLKLRSWTLLSQIIGHKIAAALGQCGVR